MRKTRAGATKRKPLFTAIDGLGRLTELMERRRRQLAAQVDLSPQQWRVLEEIAREDFMPSLFARNQECSAASVSRTLRQLLARGLVVVSIAESDARRREYAPSRAGQRVLERVRAAREAALEAVWSDFEDKELKRFAAIAGVLADRLETYAEAASGD